MNKVFRKTLVAGAVVGIFSGGMSGNASAYVYNVGSLEVDNFLFSGTIATVATYNFQLTNSAQVGNIGSSNPPTTSCLGNGIFGLPGSFTTCNATAAGPVLDGAKAEVGTTQTNNDFTKVGAVGQYARSDSVIWTAELVNSPFNPNKTAPSKISQLVESNLSQNSFANSQNTLTSTTGITFSVTAPNATVNLQFDADLDLKADTADPLGNFINGATSGATVTIRKSDNTASLVWTIKGNGLGTNDCVTTGGVVCAEVWDGANLVNLALQNPEADLNAQVGANFAGGLDTYSLADLFSRYGIRATGLPSGEYTVVLSTSLTTTSFRDARAPEPASLALLGLGLLGMGAGLRRRNRNA